MSRVTPGTGDKTAPGSVLLAAGGTGGHLFPAQALAEVLKAEGWRVHLVTDERGGRYDGTFPAEAIHIVTAATIASRAPLALASSMVRLLRGLIASLALLRRIRPDVVVGFGGYPTLPPLAAARLKGVPYILHEQNAVMGRANRALAGRAAAIATGFPELGNVPDAVRGRIVHTGNPARALVIDAAMTPYAPPRAAGAFKLLVFGGSQGARVFGDVVPNAVGLLDAALCKRIRIVQQARQGDVARVRAQYEAAGVKAQVEPFFSDLPQRMADAHLIIARSGAGTVSELALIGRPSILVPLPHSIDNDQAMNAQALAMHGGASILPQSDFTPERLARELALRMADPAGLRAAAEAARIMGRPDAARQLAALVAQVAQGAWPGRQNPESGQEQTGDAS